MNEMVPDIDNDLDVIFGEYKDKDAVENFVRAVRASNLTGTLYIGYPVLNIDDDKIEFDALLVSRDRGVIIFDLFLAGSDDGDGEESRSLHIERLYAALSNRLNSFAELRDGRRLGVEIVTVAIDPISDKFEEEADNFNVGLDRLSDLPEVSPKLRPNNERIEHLNAAIQRISNLRPKRNAKVSRSRTLADTRSSRLRRILPT